MSPQNTEHSKERRAAARRRCHQPCLVRFDRRHLDGQPGSVGSQGAISDLSACGLALLLRPAVPPGATLAIGPLGWEGAALPTARVVHCAQVGRHWRHGCVLQRQLSPEELRAWLT